MQPIDVQHPDWSALGHAVDYRLRLSLGRPLGAAVALGIQAMGSGRPLPGAPASGARAALHTAGLELLSAVDNCLARPGLLGEEDLSRLCFVAAYFEDIFRSGQVRRFNSLATADGATGLGRLCAGVREYVVEDLARQMELADGPFKDFRSLPDQARVCGPSFAGSTDIGGSRWRAVSAQECFRDHCLNLRRQMRSGQWPRPRHVPPGPTLGPCWARGEQSLPRYPLP